MSGLQAIAAEADAISSSKDSVIAAALEQVVRDVPTWAIELPVGLVSPAPGVRFMAMHSWERSASDGGTQLLHPGQLRSRDIVWGIEPLGALLDKVDASGRMEVCSCEQVLWRKGHYE